ncbi:MAG: hypothetical protein K0M48_10285 [Thiobacillus sp.]|nr:hypothetical protein [Thiobacillus sp.]
MNALSPFDQTASFAGVALKGAGVCAGPMTPYPLRDRSGIGKHLDFVERRRIDAGASDNLVRSRAVLGFFVGLVWGLVVSAVLIIGVSVGLALTGVSWMVAGQYCVAIIFLVFGLVGVLLYWGTRTECPCTAGIQRYMESAVERRRPYLYLSSINALENARRLGMWERRI